MRGTLLLVAIVGFAAGLFAQVPNSGFENWTLGNPDSWVTSNAPPAYTNVTKSTTAHSGSASARGDAIILGPQVIPATIQSGAGGHGFGVSTRYAAVTGWYMMNSVGGDGFGCNFNLYKNGSRIATGAQILPAASSWTQFTVNFGYSGAGVPDTCILQMLTAISGGGPVHAGSWFMVDDLSFSGVNAVEQESTPLQFALEQNYPNPFNPATVIRYQVPVASQVRLAVYDLLGRETAVMVNEQKDPGAYAVRFDAGGLPSGMYLYRLQARPLVDGRAGSYIQARTLTLIR